MKMGIITILVLLASHWFADFVVQTHWQATNKSKNNVALGLHVTTYMSIIAIVSFLLLKSGIGWICFVVVNSVAHFATDYVTSRMTSRLYARQDWHNFFVVVGFDQLIHQTTLITTLFWFQR